MDELLSTDAALRAEASALLARLRPAIERFAPLHVVGSYALELMVWRDLDLLLDAPGMTIERFFELGRDVAAVLGPRKMSFTDYRTERPGDYSPGLYWGIRVSGWPTLADVARVGNWKIDLWAFESDVAAAKLRECASLQSRLTPENRLTILRLKSQLWDHPQYRKDLTSRHIYDAVLDHGATSVDDVWTYLNTAR